jgi:hypothetical protein
MPAVTYQLYFDNQPASQTQLDLIDEIEVHQEIDMAWEARLTVPIRTDNSGNWLNDSESFMQEFTRVRIEVRVADGNALPLIDGPVVGRDSMRSTEPGISTLTVIVHDDSALLNRRESVAVYEEQTDADIASALFAEATSIAQFDVDSTPPMPDTLGAVMVQRGTAMQTLRMLARRQGFHVYVLPGSSPGASVGCFKALAPTTPTAPPLILLGTERNVESFTFQYDALEPRTAQAQWVSLGDKSTASSESSSSDLDLFGEGQVSAGDMGLSLAAPGVMEPVDTDTRTRAITERAAYALTVEGAVLGERYSGVLVAYQTIQIQGANPSLSGDYLIRRVTHRLTRGEYNQSFVLTRNARSESSGAGSLIGGIF